MANDAPDVLDHPLKELMERWRGLADDDQAFWHSVHPRDTLRTCADELDAALRAFLDHPLKELLGNLKPYFISKFQFAQARNGPNALRVYLVSDVDAALRAWRRPHENKEDKIKPNPDDYSHLRGWDY